MSNLTMTYLETLDIAKQEIKESLINKGVSPAGGYTSFATAIDNIKMPKIEDGITKTYKENGIYNIEPNEGYDGLARVDVVVDIDIPVFETQTKTIPITENGSQTITPDSGYDGLSEVVVDVEVTPDLQSKTIPITENGSKTISYDENYDGLSEVVVEVDVPIPTYVSQSKSITIKKNGSQTVSPDSGYDGLSEVEITVDVASGGGGGDSGKPKILNGFRFTGGNMALVDFSQYDWSLVYDTSEFFRGCTHSTGDWTNFEENFNGELLSGNNMFYGCSNLTSLPQLNTSKVVDLSSMFQSCSNLTTIPQMDTSNAVNLSKMFYGCYKLTSIPQLNTSKAVDLSGLFYQCTNLTSIPQMDTSNVTSMKDLFAACLNLTSIPQLNTSKVTDTSGMFNSCSKLTAIPQLDTSNVKTFGGNSIGYGMFNDCQNLESVGVLDLSSATHLGYIFSNCYKLREVKFKGDPSKVTAYNSMFSGAGKNVEGGSILYYDSRYDYSNIINNLPSTWTAIPYDVVE